MPTRKKIEFKQIEIDFKKICTLVFDQLNLLEELISENIKIDKKIMEQANNREGKIDQLEIKISDEIVAIIGLQSPFASELRMLIAMQRMVINLERIGDLAMNIIFFISNVKEKQIPCKYSESIANMLVISNGMVKKALKSFDLQDKDYAIWTIKNDEIVDEFYDNFLKKMINKTQLDEKTQKLFFEFININNIISNVERIADNATNIAEASIYYLKGVDLRHNDTIELDKI